MRNTAKGVQEGFPLRIEASNVKVRRVGQDSTGRRDYMGI
jgi:hypothetical protein